MKFEIRKSVHGEFYWILKASNGQVLADSGETYTAKQSAMESVANIQANVHAAEVADLAADKDADSIPSQIKELGEEVAQVRRRTRKTKGVK